MERIISYDLGTGGIKASLFDEEGCSIASSFHQYETFYKDGLIHEQRPDDWWDAVVASTHNLLEKSGIRPNEIAGISISGHSLGVVPLDKQGRLLRERTPIWSDGRAYDQAAKFFNIYDYDKWYLRTGNGFPAHLYSVFKILWYKDNEPELFEKTYKFLGTKDYINYRLTGVMATDHSYASGSGVYSLLDAKYDDELLTASGVSQDLLADILPSIAIIGRVSKEGAYATGLAEGTKVVCGGVDNSCMALGAACYSPGRVYTSLGTSAWIAVSDSKPIVDVGIRPFVFAHVVEGQFASAVSIFSAGNSLRWIRDNICPDLVAQAEQEGRDPYQLMDRLAEQSPIGANKLIFNPNLAGGSSFEASQNIKGGYAGLVLGHNRSDLIRSAMEGIAMNLGVVFRLLKKLCPVSDKMLMVGGGSKSKFWRQIFADVYQCDIVKTNVDQDAASLGAAALAAVGLGIWEGFDNLDRVHQVQDISKPLGQNVKEYEKYIAAFEYVAQKYADIGDMLASID